MDRPVRLLFLSDTHLGFDEPLRPRSARRHRGPDFFSTYQRAIDVARAEKVDAVIHGGDLLYRSRVPDSLVDRAMAPLVALAEAGIHVFVIPGNHERSFIPRTLFSLHDRLHVFSEPRTFLLTVGGTRTAIGGFPCVRNGVRDRFPELLAETGMMAEPADVRFLCMHQLFEGARVGPSGYAFRGGEDVVRASDLPPGMTAVLCGHVHRHQVLRVDLAGRPLAAPVVYAGSTERTSFAEVDETKGFVSLVTGSNGSAAAPLSMAFHALPARPMYSRTIGAGPLLSALERLRASLEGIDPGGILQVRIGDERRRDSRRIIAAVKAMVAPTLVLSFRLPLEPERPSDSTPC